MTALKEEREAVLRFLEKTEDLERGEPSYIKGVPKQDELDCEVIVCHIGKGTEVAAAGVSKIIQKIDPSIVMFVGIAGGLRDVNLGDVVFADLVRGYEYGAEEDSFKRRDTARSVSYRSKECARAVEKEDEWHKWCKIEGCNVSPEVIGGNIASGSKVLKSLESPVVKLLKEEFTDCVAVEMEGLGFLEGAYQSEDTDALVIRGISDQISDKEEAEEKGWTETAAAHAAAFAMKVLEKYQKNYIEPQKKSSRAAAYEKRFTKEIRGEIDFPEPKFELKPKYEDSGLQVDEMENFLDDKPRIIFTGGAGRGKSVFLARLALDFQERKSNSVIFINLKHWSEEYSEELKKFRESPESSKEGLDTILKCSVADLDLDFLDELLKEREKVYLIIDGLNEVSSEDAKKNILSVCRDYSRGHPDTLRILGSDRKIRDPIRDKGWEEVELPLLSNEEVKEYVNNEFGEEGYENLSEYESDLLRTPYFLDLALEMENPRFRSKSEAIERFFLDEFPPEDLEKLSKAAFLMYRNYKTISFKSQKFKEEVGGDLHKKLRKAEIIKEESRKNGTIRSYFGHQLQQDFLTALYLAPREEKWEPRTFDDVTLKSNSLDVLSMTLEQIDDEEKGLEFLKEVYDWNWPATFRCLRDNWPPEDKSIREFAEAVLFINAEKQFDPMQHTRERMRGIFDRFPGKLADKLASFENRKQILWHLEENIEYDTEWFDFWHSLYDKGFKDEATEQEIRRITSTDSVIGWTVANVLKRVRLSDGDLQQLRAFLNLAEWNNNTDGTISKTVAWRVVHVLGAYPSEENYNLLLEALNNASYMWIRYGAVRSLIEMAAETSELDLREKIFENLQEQVGSMHPRVKEEVARSLFYKNPPANWFRLGKPLLETLIDEEEDSDEQEVWEKKLKKFKSRFGD